MSFSDPTLPTVFGDLASGNLHKVQLILALNEQRFNRVQMSQPEGNTRDERFLRLNPLGKYPLVLLPGGTILRESGAILYYFGRESALWPREVLEQTRILQWMFFEQYTHEPSLAVYRFRLCWLKEENPALKEKCLEVLAHLEKELKNTSFICNEKLTLADLALYPYTKAISDTDISLGAYPSIRNWLEKLENLDRFTAFGQEAAEQTLSFDEYFGSEP